MSPKKHLPSAPAITVIIPVLNGMPYLPLTLASLEAQTFREFQVILWDNGSTDGTVEEAKRWIPSRLRGKVVADRPLPLHECLAAMVEEAGSEFCARLDADDCCVLGRLESQWQVLHSNPSLVAVGSQAIFMDSNGNPTGEQTNFPQSSFRILAGMLIENQMLHPTLLFRREAVLRAGNYRIGKPCEDYDMWLRLSLQGQLANLAEPLIHYRIHDRSVIALARENNQLEAPNARCVAEVSAKVFGISAAGYQKLRQKRHRFAAWPLMKAASVIAHRSGTGILQVAMSPEFIWSARCLTSKVDLVSRGCWGFFERLASLMRIR